MKIPNRITLGPHTYEIRSDPDTARLLRDEGCNGDSRPDQHVIRIDTERPHTGAAETLLHETLHCCWHQTGLPVDLADHEETIVTALAPPLLHLLRRNPKLVRYLLADDH